MTICITGTIDGKKTSWYFATPTAAHRAFQELETRSHISDLHYGQH